METKDRIPVGGVIFADAPVSFNEDRPVTAVTVRNTGDRPIQVGSHFHFFEVNRALEFDRAASYGKRLNIASTTAVRFEPGDEKDVELVPFGGLRAVHGFNGLAEAWTGDVHLRTLNLARADALGFKNVRH